MGGNIFRDKAGPINKEHITPTFRNYVQELKFLFPRKANVFNEFFFLGSAFKKPTSGDLDVGIDFNAMFPTGKITFDDLMEFEIDPEDYLITHGKIKKRARSATKEQTQLKAFCIEFAKVIEANSLSIVVESKKTQSGNVFTCFPQFDEQNNIKPGNGVQIDIMIGDKDWLEFSYYSESYEGNVKGLHRTQMIVALLASQGYTFSHAHGVKNKETQEKVATRPTQIVELIQKLYNIKINEAQLYNFYTIIHEMEDNVGQTERFQVYDSYLRILDSTRCDIPTMLQDYWIENQERLGLKGKFLPETSNLKNLVA